MPYLIQGNAHQLTQVFNMSWLHAAGDKMDGARHIMLDLASVNFLGTSSDAQYFIDLWKKSTHEATYAQGDMSAANLFLLLGHTHLFKKEDEELEEYRDNYVGLSFAYVNDKKEPCGLTIHYRKDAPAQWLITHARNSHLSPHERQITIFGSFDLNSFAGAIKDYPALWVVDKRHNSFVAEIASPLVSELLTYFLSTDSEVLHPRFLRILQLMRVFKLDDACLLDDAINPKKVTADTLFNDNKVLDLIQKYQIKLTFNLLIECLDTTSELYKAIASLEPDERGEINACLLKMYLHCHEQGMLIGLRELLEEHFFKKTKLGMIWNAQQIQLIPFLAKNYPPELGQLILANEAYYSALIELVELNLTHDLPLLFSNKSKLSELEFLNRINNKNLKQLCLIFWIKGTLSSREYQEIINAGSSYPLLAEALVALDKENETSITDLKYWALNPQQHLQQSILYHFGKDYTINRSVLSKLSTKELVRLNSSLLILKRKRTTTTELFDEAARDNQQGQLLRLFLPVIDSISNPLYRDALIDLLYEGVRKGPISLSKAIAEIAKDSLFYHEACALQDRFLCAKQMQMLGLEMELVECVALSNEYKANNLRRFILTVEQRCKDIYEHILSANVSPAEAKEWSCVEKEYRKTLYQLAYAKMNDASFEFKPQLHAIQNKVLKLVDPEVTSWLQKALIAIANLFITLCTAGYANKQHYAMTGSYWFFTQTTSGEKVRAIEKDFVFSLA